MKKVIILTIFFTGTSLLYAKGILESHSGKFERFSYIDGSITRNANAEYIGLYWKTVYIDGSGGNSSMVIAANFMPWNSHEYTGWEELSREPYPYADNDTVMAELSGVDQVSVSEMDGRIYFLEIIPDSNGNYFWIDGDGDWGFYQEVYIKR